jgi:ADP-ribose diphosphatase
MTKQNTLDLNDKIKPLVMKEQWLCHSQLFHIQQQTLKFSNGVERTYERINPQHQRAVMVVPMLDEETVILVREYGAGLGKYYLSLPKGAMEKDESIEDAANREIMEEIGYGAHSIHFLTQLAQSPSYMGNRINIVIAQNLFEKRLPGDEPEPLDLVPVKLRELSKLLAHPDFVEAYAVSALYMTRDWLKGERFD